MSKFEGKNNAHEARKKCSICGGPLGSRPQDHHISYEPEIKMLICFNCHQWYHGRTVYPYKLKPGKKKNLTIEDKQKIAKMGFEFSRKVVIAYKNRLKEWEND